MKIYFTKSMMLMVIVLVTCINSRTMAQTYDVVSIGAGYPNQSFYSLNNGEVSNVVNTNWDLAFQISGFQATILVNGKNNVRLFKSGLDVNSWSAITANDTVGVLNSGNELLNQDTSWWAGAFNLTNDIANQFDLGWGVYDFATHVVTGDSLYFIKLSNGLVKKLWIQALANSTYSFVYADVDGSNEVNASLNKQNYAGKNFGYYSIVDGLELDREPNKYLWDVTFMQYMATTPFVYKVTGVLSNDSIQAVKAYPVDPATVSPWGYTFSNHISTIGYDWKSFDFGTNTWTIQDSTVYYIYDRNGNLWKMEFVGFGGSANGDFEFNKQQVSSTGISENGGQPALLNVYPNPASSMLNVVCFINENNIENKAAIYDLTGNLVSEINLSGFTGLKNMNVDVSQLNSGLYILKFTVDGVSTSQRVSIVK